MFVYVGTYTEPPAGHAGGLLVFRFDVQTGALSDGQTLTGIVNPSFLTSTRDSRRLYAVNEQDAGRVTAFTRDPGSGVLTVLNSQATHGADPCYLALDPSERFVLVTNYTGGSVAVLPIANDGTLEPASCVIAHTGSSVNPTRQREPHPHMIAPGPDGVSVLVTDLGADRIVVYQLDHDRGQLVERTSDPRTVATTPGSGPRHFAFAPNGRTLYVINELDSTIAVYSAGHDLRLQQTVSTIPERFLGTSHCAEIVIAPDGRFVYGSNRGHDSIAIFAVDLASGELTAIGYQSTLGRTPRGFRIDPSGEWLVVGNQESDTIVVFRRDQESGLLHQQGGPIAVPSPVAVLFA